MVTYSLNSEAVEKAMNEWLTKRGVRREDIAELVYLAQQEYYPVLTMDECRESVDRVLAKREVHNAILTGIQLDILAEEGKLLSPLQEMIENDEKLYGCDEILALSIVNVYGSIGFTNFGFLDKTKPGIVDRLNRKGGPMLHTFLDDIVSAIAASACSRLAHRKQAHAEEHELV
ncbi:phosphatidylglycerophosphatase A [Paenibacillus aurantius]|uniref:Phosphatidylglycerophosphatase A n=1 Tax=Paenibacillus aurantius TaxID=2918900 RepID=A0AA96LI10_9BACL|nr:phosphatidylglycerophosphatase A [Paenibacillus aurantius]WNQ14181.1 phosphatidylglycerophosphatase A [Paenibacillus aurantius]